MKRIITSLTIVAAMTVLISTTVFGQTNDINLLNTTAGNSAVASQWGNFLNSVANSGSLFNGGGNATAATPAIAPQMQNEQMIQLVTNIFGLIGQLIAGFSGANLGTQMPISFPQVTANANMNQANPLNALFSSVLGQNTGMNTAGNEGVVAANQNAGAQAPAATAPAADGGLPVPVYNQNNVGAGSNGGRYCGPTSVKMVLEYFGIKHDVNTIGSKVMTPSSGASHQGMLDYVKNAGLTGSTMEYGVSLDWMRQQTAAGKPVLASVKGNYGPRSTNGHIVVVTGVTPAGNIIINDPAGGKRLEVNGSTFMRANRGRMAIAVSK